LRWSGRGGLRSGIQSLGLRVYDSWFMPYGSWFMVYSIWFEIYHLSWFNDMTDSATQSAKKLPIDGSFL
jgi:hypothetical protein